MNFHTFFICYNNFSYEGYAARLLTYQEVVPACYDGVNEVTWSRSLFKKCKYLSENTGYSKDSDRIRPQGFWFETPTSYGARDVLGQSGRIGSLSANNGYSEPSNDGVRPVIEVQKVNLEI